jgi:hypothetical protein
MCTEPATNRLPHHTARYSDLSSAPILASWRSTKRGKSLRGRLYKEAPLRFFSEFVELFCGLRSLHFYLTFMTINVMSSCCAACPSHLNTFPRTIFAASCADNRSDSSRIDRSFASPNSIPVGLRASVTPSV